MTDILTDEIIISCESLIRVKFELVKYPKLDSKKKLIKKGLILLEKHTPKISNYIAKQKALAEICKFQVIITSKRKRKPKKIKKYFKLWIKKEKFKRLIFLILEGLVLPITPFLAIIPGPNIFFYIPFLLFYFHLQSFKGLKKLDIDLIKINMPE